MSVLTLQSKCIPVNQFMKHGCCKLDNCTLKMQYARLTRRTGKVSIQRSFHVFSHVCLFVYSGLSRPRWKEWSPRPYWWSRTKGKLLFKHNKIIIINNNSQSGDSHLKTKSQNWLSVLQGEIGYPGNPGLTGVKGSPVKNKICFD